LGDEADSIKDWARRVLAGGASDKVFTHLMDKFGALLITEALNITGGNRSQAAKMLGLSRPTLLAKMEKFGIKIKTAAESD